MAVFDHYLMAPFERARPLLERYPYRYAIHARTTEERSTRFCELSRACDAHCVVELGLSENGIKDDNGLVLPVTYSTDPADAVVKRLLRLVEERSWNPDEIAVDVTSMPTEYALLLLRGLRERLGATRTLVAYTEAGEYTGTEFTGGLKEINTIPGFIGSPDILKPDLLIIILGFEGHRSLAVYNKVDPELLYVINGFPALKPGWDEVSLTSNVDLIQRAVETVRCPANNPFELVNVLEEVYQEFSGQYNINIAPLGSRPHTLGTALFAMRRPDVRLIYHYPLVLKPQADGCGTTWLYVVTHADLSGG